MGKVAIFTDSVASIPESILETLDIQWVPYYIHWGKEVMRDLTTIQREAFYKWLPTADELPTTASPGPRDYLEMYEKLAKEQNVNEIVSIHMTSKGSGLGRVAVAELAATYQVSEPRVIELVRQARYTLAVRAARRESIRGETLMSDSQSRAPGGAYMNPYLAGIGLGLVLLAAFVVMGRGLGASGAFSSTVAWIMDLVAPAHAAANEYYRGYLEGGTHPLKAWLVFEVLGVTAGALLSGLLAGRVRLTIEKGPRVGNGPRLAAAFTGGMLMPRASARWS